MPDSTDRGQGGKSAGVTAQSAAPALATQNVPAGAAIPVAPQRPGRGPGGQAQPVAAGDTPAGGHRHAPPAGAQDSPAGEVLPVLTTAPAGGLNGSGR